MVIGIVAIIILGVIAYFLCELSEVPEEEYKPRKKIEKIYIRGTFTKNQKRICRKLNEIIDVLNMPEGEE